MVCIYCGNETKVVNSRHQKRINQVWRRRKCLACQAVFTTLEAVNTEQALQVRHGKSLQAFSRDTLLLSVYDSLRHRKTAVSDATALTETVLSALYPHIQDASIEKVVIAEITAAILERFDKIAATHYRAFHPTD
ncbi:MAG: nrdR [Candidatus Saccharibacteria bacterium]|nr:nrdR [Candidatus Saccharibacteria bacterium]